MHKLLIKIIAICLLLAMLVPFASCGNDEESEGGNSGNNSSAYHTITFNTKGGSTIRSMTVKHGSFATAPADPVMDNYVFCRWETDKGRAFFFDSYTVNEDLNLEAIWIKAEDLFNLAPMPDSDGIMITKIKHQEDFDVLYVPKIINGKKVEGIGANAFKGVIDSHASTIVFPDSIRYIGEYAFAGISEVNLLFTGVITHIEQSSFYNCLTLQSITLGEGITEIPYCAFYGCVSLRNIAFPEGVTLIDENAIEEASNLLTVVIPSTVTKIDNSAFSDCDALTAIFFGGSEDQFDQIYVALGNDPLHNTEIYFYSENEPTESGNFWHYDKNNIPEIW